MNTATGIINVECRRQDWECGRRKSASDRNTFAFPAARFPRGTSSAFTLIELLVVVGVIVLLAGMSFPALRGIQRVQAFKRARVELGEIETAIEAYKIKLGYYPPDNTPNWTANQLYYELMGTTKDSAGYQTLDGSARILNTDFAAAFGSGSKVTGFMNCTPPGAGDDVAKAVKFLRNLKDLQFLAATAPVTATVLGVSLQGVPVFSSSNNKEIIPYGYNSSNPLHNPKSFDLWVDIIAGDKTNRISNWSARPIVISTPAYN
jgi:type II secretory pathway pseudopilin PulG